MRRSLGLVLLCALTCAVATPARGTTEARRTRLRRAQALPGRKPRLMQGSVNGEQATAVSPAPGSISTWRQPVGGGGCANADPAEDQMWTRTGPGWTGGDAAYSVVLPDGRAAWFFGDTFLGTINGDGSRPASAALVHNALVTQSGGALTTHYGRAGGLQPVALVRPAGNGQFYWPGAGLAQDGELTMFVLGFRRTGVGSWDFAYTRSGIAVFALPSLTLRTVIPVPATDGVEWGTWVLSDGPYTYIYGVEDDRSVKYVHVARVPLGQLGASWQYYGASGWSDDPAASARVLAGVANDFSVVRIDGAYDLISQDPDLGPGIYGYAGDTPVGPFTSSALLYSTPNWGPGTFTYNALAHPVLSDSRGLLVSYDVNFASFEDNYSHASVYRPRFIRVPYDCFPSP